MDNPPTPSSSSSSNGPQPSSTPAEPAPQTRPINPISGFPEPYSRVRETRPLWFRYLGLETTMDVLSYRPGTKMISFLLASSLVAGAIYYDRSEARRITREAAEQVQELGQAKIGVSDLPRKVDVYAARIPEDSEEERGLVYFKKYIKPILLAAGIDYEYLPGQIPGSLARVLLARYKLQRLEAEAKLKATGANTAAGPTLRPGQSGYVEQYNEQHAREGGIVLIGRNTMKEYLWALKEAWTTPLDLEREQRIADSDVEAVEDEELKEFARVEGLFEPPPAEASDSTSSSSQHPILGSAFRDTYASIAKSTGPIFEPSSSTEEAEPAPKPMLPPSEIPQQPPLLLVPFSHPLGSMRFWPQKIYSHFFGHRHKAEAGAQAALDLIYARTRPFEPPARSQGLMTLEEESRAWLNEEDKMQADSDDWRPKFVGGDCDWEAKAEYELTKHYRKLPEFQSKNQKAYLTELPSRINAARSGGSDKTETELLEERIRKEKRWRRELHGWRLDRPGSSVTWVEQMADKLSVFTTRSTEPEQADKTV